MASSLSQRATTIEKIIRVLRAALVKCILHAGSIGCKLGGRSGVLKEKELEIGKSVCAVLNHSRKRIVKPLTRLF
jgi:hypothetical protein